MQFERTSCHSDTSPTLNDRHGLSIACATKEASKHVLYGMVSNGMVEVLCGEEEERGRRERERERERDRERERASNLATQ